MFYRGIKNLHLIWYEDVANEFIKGIRLYKENGIICRESLDKGATEYNIEILRDLKEIQNQYSHVIVIESIIVNFIKNHMQEESNTTGYIWHLIMAQKKTADFISVFIKALKQYAVTDIKLYKCLRKKVDSLQERVERNLKFTDEHMRSFGLQPFLDVIKEDYGMSIYEYIDHVGSEFLSETNLKKSDENFWEKRNSFICNKFVSIANAYKIDITNLVAQAEIAIRERYDEIQCTEKTYKQQQKQALTDKMSKEDNISLRNSIENGDDRIHECRHMIETMKSMNGIVWYLTILKGSKLHYIGYNMELTKYVGRARLFPSADCDEIEQTMASYVEKHPNAILSMQCLDFPKTVLEQAFKASAEPIEIEDLTEHMIKSQEKTLYDLLNETWDISMRATCRTEFELMKNNGNLYAICVIKGTSYTVKPYWMSNRIQEDGEFITSELTNAMNCIKWYYNEKDAQNMVSILEKRHTTAKLKFYVIHLEHYGPYKLHDYIMNRHLPEKLDRLCSVIENMNKTEINGYFRHLSDFEQFVCTIDMGPACIVISQECSLEYGVQYMGNPGKIFSPKDVMDSHIHNPAIINSDNREAMTQLKSTCKQLHESYGYDRVFCIVEFAKGDDHYTHHIVYAPWEQIHNNSFDSTIK